MKIFLPFVVLAAGAGLMQAAIIETISFNLSALNPGSTLSGTFTLSNTPMPGDTASASLSFSDPSDYSPTSLTTTITIESGTPTGFAVDFSQLMFTNLNGTNSGTGPNTRDVLLTRTAIAQCASFPCTATGIFEDRSPPVFTSTYTISPATAVPEPGYALLVAVSLTALALARRRLQAS